MPVPQMPVPQMPVPQPCQMLGMVPAASFIWLRHQQHLVVWSRSKVGWASVKATRIFLPFGADEFVGRKPLQPLQSLGKGIS